MEDVQCPVPYRLHGNAQQDQGKIIQSIENITHLAPCHKPLADPYRQKRHSRSSQHGYILAQMFSAVLVPFLYNPGHRNLIENICLKPYSQCNMPSSSRTPQHFLRRKADGSFRKTNSRKVHRFRLSYPYILKIPYKAVRYRLLLIRQQ